MSKEPVEYLIESYYKQVFRYCYSRLSGDFQAAEDCTQEVMIVLYKKVNQLDMSRDMRPWLYSVADKTVKSCRRKKPDIVDIETVSQQFSETPFAESILDILEEDERRLIESYFIGEDKSEIAKRNGLTLGALYTKVSRIRKKLIQNFDKTAQK